MKTLRKKITLISLLILSLSSFGQNNEQRLMIIKEYDLNKLNSLSDKFSRIYTENKERANKLAKENNWSLIKYDIKGQKNELQYIEEGRPIYFTTFNHGGSITLKTNQVNSGGALGLDLNGQNMFVGVWDGGKIRSTHQDLIGRVIFKDGAATLDDHATHVAGTIIGSGFGNPFAKGMAFEASVWGNDWSNDLSEATTQASQGLLVSNHSYGTQAEGTPLWQYGAYNSTSAAWDDVMYNAPYYQVVFAAGNDRDSYGTLNPTKGGSDMLRNAGTSKNVIVVAAVNEVPNYTGPNSVIMSSFSNWGPTDDKRIKPDISAKGVGVVSTVSTGDTDYEAMWGTSMAAPGIAGSLILLQQQYFNLKNQYMKSSTLRGLMIHTADEAGTSDGPDHRFGWGLMNTENAVKAITSSINPSTSNGTVIRELALNQSGTYTENITSDGINPLKVTLCWTDPAGNATSGTVDDISAKLINDLDIKIVKGTSNFFPWTLLNNNVAAKIPNSKDNVEKVEISNPSGQYQIQISHKGNLSSGQQNYSLIMSGINSTLNTKENDLEHFSLSPNPVKSHLSIHSTNNETVETIAIYDLQGRLILENKEKSNTINVSQIPFGSYIIKITSQNDKVSTKKFIKI